MKLFKELERLDSMQPKIANSFEQAHAEHEKTILNYLNLGYGVEHLEAMMFELAQGFLGSDSWELTDEQLKKLTRIKQNYESNLEASLFRAYLLSKRAKELYDDRNLTDKSVAFVHLYQAGIFLGQFLSETRKINTSLHLSRVAQKRNIRNQPVYEKLAELIRDKRPTEGWRFKTSMAASLAPAMSSYINQAGMQIMEENVEKSIIKWVGKYQFLTDEYNLNSAKFIKKRGAAGMDNRLNSDSSEIS